MTRMTATLCSLLVACAGGGSPRLRDAGGSSDAGARDAGAPPGDAERPPQDAGRPPRPMGDGTCAAPLDLGTAPSGLVAVSNEGTGDNVVPGCGGSRMVSDVVLRWLAPMDGTLRVAAVGRTVDDGTIDTVLHAHRACPGTAADEVACNDDGGEGASAELRLDVRTGDDLYIVVDGYNTDDVGAIDVDWELTDEPADSALCNGGMAAMDVGGDPSVTVMLSLDGMTMEHARPSSACSPSCSAREAGDVILRYTPPRDGMLTASTDNEGTASIDTVVSIFGSCAGDASPILACDDDGGTGTGRGLSSVARGRVTGGVPVFIAVDVCSATATGAAVVTLSLADL